MQNKTAKFFKFVTVTKSEIDKIQSNRKFRNLIQLLNKFAAVPGAPTHWLITSVDNSAKDGSPRKSKAPSTNHQNSRALDILPLSNNLMIRLPIPLNRNVILSKSLKTLAEMMFDVTKDLPIVAFEADHIHTDINHPGDFVFYNQTRTYMDKAAAIASKIHPVLSKALDDSTLQKV